MNTPADLTQVLAEWRRLAEAQGEGIRSGNWSFVAECQKAVTALQSSSDAILGQTRSSTGTTLPSVNKRIYRSTVLELIDLQRRNLSALQQRREKLSSQIEHVTRTSRNLRGIQRSYASPGATGWSSYS